MPLFWLFSQSPQLLIILPLNIRKICPSWFIMSSRLRPLTSFEDDFLPFSYTHYLNFTSSLSIDHASNRILFSMQLGRRLLSRTSVTEARRWAQQLDSIGSHPLGP